MIKKEKKRGIPFVNFEMSKARGGVEAMYRARNDAKANTVSRASRRVAAICLLIAGSDVNYFRTTAENIPQ